MTTPSVPRTEAVTITGRSPRQAVVSPPSNRIATRPTMPTVRASSGSLNSMPPGPSEPSSIPSARNATSSGTPLRLAKYAPTTASRSTAPTARSSFPSIASPPGAVGHRTVAGRTCRRAAEPAADRRTGGALMSTQPERRRADFAVIGAGTLWDGIAYWATIAGVYLMVGGLMFYSGKGKLFDDDGNAPAAIEEQFENSFLSTFPGIDASWVILGILELAVFALL